DKAGHVSNGEALLAGGDNPEVGHERGEWIVGNFGTSGRHCGNKAGFAGRGEANEGDVGNAFEFEHQLLLLTGLAEQREARGLATAGGECLVAETTTATGSSNVTGACPHKVRQH